MGNATVPGWKSATTGSTAYTKVSRHSTRSSTAHLVAVLEVAADLHAATHKRCRALAQRHLVLHRSAQAHGTPDQRRVAQLLLQRHEDEVVLAAARNRPPERERKSVGFVSTNMDNILTPRNTEEKAHGPECQRITKQQQGVPTQNCLEWLRGGQPTTAARNTGMTCFKSQPRQRATSSPPYSRCTLTVSNSGRTSLTATGTVTCHRRRRTLHGMSTRGHMRVCVILKEVQKPDTPSPPPNSNTQPTFTANPRPSLPSTASLPVVLLWPMSTTQPCATPAP